jgi:nickel transport protein
VSEEQLTRIIESTLERKLAPIKRSLAKQQEQQPSLQDILGGIGYIFGLAGIAAYFKSKKMAS